MKKINLLDILVFIFVLLFVYAASSKLLDYELFQAQIGKSPLITKYSVILSWLVPILETLISLLLLIPKTQLVGLYAFFSLMLIFTLYILFILNFSPYVPCSCGGILSNMGWTEHLIFNIVFCVLPLVGIVLHNRQKEKIELVNTSI